MSDATADRRLDALRAAVEPELRPGEQITWLGRPDPDRAARAARPQIIGGLIWLTFCAGFATAWFLFVGAMSRNVGAALIGPLFMVPFVLVGLWMLVAPGVTRRSAMHTVYALTDRRAILIRGSCRGGRSVRSFAPEQLTDLKRSQKADGSGDLILTRDVQSDSDGKSQATDVGFTTVEDVKAVEARVRALVWGDRNASSSRAFAGRQGPLGVDTSGLSESLRSIVESEPGPGERIVWMEHPIPRLLMRDASSTVTFGLLWTAFTATATAFLAVGMGQSKLGIAPLIFVWSVGAVFILVGLAMISAPFWAWRGAWRTVYALTDRRAILFKHEPLNGVTVRSLEPEQLGNPRGNRNADGSGDLVLVEESKIGVDGSNHSIEITFAAIRDVKEVEQMVRTLARESREQGHH